MVTTEAQDPRRPRPTNIELPQNDDTRASEVHVSYARALGGVQTMIDEDSAMGQKRVSPRLEGRPWSFDRMV